MRSGDRRNCGPLIFSFKKEENKMSYSYICDVNHTPSSIDMDEQVKKYAAEDAKALSEKVTKEMDARHLETLKEQTKAYSREEQFAVACAIMPDVLLEALKEEIRRLSDFENYIRNGVS